MPRKLKYSFGFADILSLISLGILVLTFGITTVSVFKNQNPIEQAAGGCTKNPAQCKASEECINGVCKKRAGGAKSAIENAPGDSKTSCNNNGGAWCTDCGGFCITGANQTCIQAAAIKCGATYSPSSPTCDANSNGTVVVNGSGENNQYYVQCQNVNGVWRWNGVGNRDCATCIRALDSVNVPTYLRSEYDEAITAQVANRPLQNVNQPDGNTTLNQQIGNTDGDSPFISPETQALQNQLNTIVDNSTKPIERSGRTTGENSTPAQSDLGNRNPITGTDTRSTNPDDSSGRTPATAQSLFGRIVSKLNPRNACKYTDGRQWCASDNKSYGCRNGEVVQRVDCNGYPAGVSCRERQDGYTDCVDMTRNNEGPDSRSRSSACKYTNRQWCENNIRYKCNNSQAAQEVESCARYFGRSCQEFSIGTTECIVDGTTGGTPQENNSNNRVQPTRQGLLPNGTDSECHNNDDECSSRNCVPSPDGGSFCLEGGRTQRDVERTFGREADPSGSDASPTNIFTQIFDSARDYITDLIKPITSGFGEIIENSNSNDRGVGTRIPSTSSTLISRFGEIINGPRNTNTSTQQSVSLPQSRPTNFYTQTQSDLDSQIIQTTDGPRRFGLIGCGPTAVSNILNQYGIMSSTPIDIASQMGVRDWGYDGTTLFQDSSLVRILNSYGLETNLYNESFYNLSNNTSPNDLIFIGGIFRYLGRDVSHISYLQTTGDTNNLILRDNLFITDATCRVTGNARLLCSNASGQSLTIDLANQPVYIIPQPEQTSQQTISTQTQVGSTSRNGATSNSYESRTTPSNRNGNSGSGVTENIFSKTYDTITNFFDNLKNDDSGEVGSSIRPNTTSRFGEIVNPQKVGVTENKTTQTRVSSLNVNASILSFAEEKMESCVPGIDSMYNACEGEYYNGEILTSEQIQSIRPEPWRDDIDGDSYQLFWCTQLVMAAAQNAGIELNPNSAYAVHSLYDDLEQRGLTIPESDLNIRNIEQRLEPGMIAFINTPDGNPYSDFDHVAIIQDVDVISTIDQNGNTYTIVNVTIVQSNAATVEATYELTSDGNLTYQTNDGAYIMSAFADLSNYDE